MRTRVGRMKSTFYTSLTSQSLHLLHSHSDSRAWVGPSYMSVLFKLVDVCSSVPSNLRGVLSMHFQRFHMAFSECVLGEYATSHVPWYACHPLSKLAHICVIRETRVFDWVNLFLWHSYYCASALYYSTSTFTFTRSRLNKRRFCTIKDMLCLASTSFIRPQTFARQTSVIIFST